MGKMSFIYNYNSEYTWEKNATIYLKEIKNGLVSSGLFSVISMDTENEDTANFNIILKFKNCTSMYTKLHITYSFGGSTQYYVSISICNIEGTLIKNATYNSNMGLNWSMSSGQAYHLYYNANNCYILDCTKRIVSSFLENQNSDSLYEYCFNDSYIDGFYNQNIFNYADTYALTERILNNYFEDSPTKIFYFEIKSIHNLGGISIKWDFGEPYLTIGCPAHISFSSGEEITINNKQYLCLTNPNGQYLGVGSSLYMLVGFPY